VLLGVFGITVLCLLIDGGVALFAKQTPETAQLQELTAKGFILGFGAIIGLVGGKTLP
jgi:hypothetical protein